MAAFYFGSDTAIDWETGEEMTTEELIAEGRRVRAEIDAEMAAAMAENEEKMADTDAAWDALAEVEALADREVEDRAAYGLAELVGYMTGEDVNSLSARQYKRFCDEVIDGTMAQDREHYYRTGAPLGTVRPWEWPL
jgi:hypothetical protein